nr:hypothetical protein [Deinococcus apachensis]
MVDGRRDSGRVVFEFRVTDGETGASVVLNVVAQSVRIRERSPGVPGELNVVEVCLDRFVREEGEDSAWACACVEGCPAPDACIRTDWLCTFEPFDVDGLVPVLENEADGFSGGVQKVVHDGQCHLADVETLGDEVTELEKRVSELVVALHVALKETSRLEGSEESVRGPLGEFGECADVLEAQRRSLYEKVKEIQRLDDRVIHVCGTPSLFQYSERSSI